MNLFKSLKKGDKVTDRWYGGIGTVVKKLKTVVYIEFRGTQNAFLRSGSCIEGLGKWDPAHVNRFLVLR